jgi:hypothetical protein
MLTPTNYTVPAEFCQLALTDLSEYNFRIPINLATGDFFYDPWIIKPEFNGTAWQRILATLPGSIGEARIISLAPGQCYQSHSDIDDRHHLTVQGEGAYLIDLDNNIMHKLHPDRRWYKMNAALLHSAANFGRTTRIQLVVRELLLKNKLVDPISIKIVFTDLSNEHARYIFDNCLSSWLNQANKIGKITNFTYKKTEVSFSLEESLVQVLRNILPDNFRIIIL